MTRSICLILLFLLHFYPYQLRGGNGDSLSTSPTAITLIINSIGTTCGKPNGRIAVIASGGTAPYSYQLNTNTPQSTGVFLYLLANTYTITVTDATSQTTSTTVTLTNTFTPPTGVNVVSTFLSGCNTRDASLTLTGIGGTAPYTFSIDHTNYQPSNAFLNLDAGSYYCAVKDANGCESPFIWFNTTNIPERCIMDQNGQVRSYVCSPFRSHLALLNVSGGVAPYQYSIDGVNFQSNPDFYPLPAGLYTIITRDAVGSILRFSVSLHDACLSPIVVNSTTQPAQCGQNGIITVTAEEGRPPYQYSIDGINFQTSNVFTGIAPGPYTIVVKDADDVIGSRFVIVGNGCLTLSTTTVNSTCGNANGSLQVQAGNGTAPYQYSINGINFQTSNLFTNLLAGTYTITVRDATGGTSTITATISDIAGPTIATAIPTATDCLNSGGTITLNVQGGTPPLEYSINGTNYQPSASFTGLSSGQYTLYTRDANGCLASAPATVQLNNNLTISTNNATICEGQNTRLQTTSNGNIFSWSPATGLSATNILNPDASPTISTTYTLTASLGVCTDTKTATVTVNPAPVADAGPDTTICIGKTLQLDGSGGVNFTWSPSTGLSSTAVPDPIVTLTTAGVYNYSLTVRDANGCSSLSLSSVRVTIISPTVFAGRDTVILSGQPLQLVASNPGNYNFTTYTWSPSTGLSNSSIPNPVTMLDADLTYTLTAQTADGCVATDNILVKVVKTADIYVPSAFTPNNDGLNDILKAIPIGIKEFRSFRIYNRWGQLVFQTNNPAQGWDGRLSSMIQPSGVFVWIADGTGYNGAIIKRKGTVVLIK